MTVSQVSLRPQESVAINRIRLAPTTGVKQTEPLESVPPVTTVELRLPFGSLLPNPLMQMGARLQTEVSRLPGHVATGGSFRSTFTVVVQVSAAPQASVAIKVMMLTPSTG